MGSECNKFHKRLAELISVQRNESYSDVINCIRTKTRFCLLRSILVAVRGERGKRRKQISNTMSEVSFNLIPDMPSYETV